MSAVVQHKWPFFWAPLSCSTSGLRPMPIAPTWPKPSVIQPQPPPPGSGSLTASEASLCIRLETCGPNCWPRRVNHLPFARHESANSAAIRNSVGVCTEQLDSADLAWYKSQSTSVTIVYLTMEVYYSYYGVVTTLVMLYGRRHVTLTLALRWCKRLSI